ncbi:hypothetical protein GE09DRAFT_1068532, partial [Coniochaeta sp. 2T2.1]
IGGVSKGCVVVMVFLLLHTPWRSARAPISIRWTSTGAVYIPLSSRLAKCMLRQLIRPSNTLITQLKNPCIHYP